MPTTSLRRTPSSSGSDTTATVSVWCKLTYSSSYHCIIGGNEGSSANDRSLFSISSDGNIYNQIVHGGTNYYQESTRQLRDHGAWYHIVIQFDTSNGTQADRIKTYVNNELITTWNVTASWPSSVPIKFWNTSNSPEFLIGCRKSSANYQYFYDGVMAHMHIVDGTVYAPSKFAETDATTGEWVPLVNPEGVTYGTNGTFFKFEDVSDMAKDSSGNDLSYSTTGSLIQTEDNPDNNFPTWNPLNHDYANTDSVYSNINNYAQAGANGAYNQSVSTMAITRGSGKWYFECKYVANDGGVGGIGILDMDKQSEVFYQNRNLSDNSANTDIGRCVYYANGYSVIPGTENQSYGGSWTTGDIIGMAVDSDNGAVYFSKNGTWQNSGDPTSGATKTGAIDISAASWWTGAQFFGIYCGDNSSSGNDSFAANFGNGYFQTTAVSTAQSDDGSVGIFEYDVPASYRALCTKNLATYG